MMVSMLGRTSAPNVYGSLYAWSLTNIKVEPNVRPIGFPFNQYFVFLMSLVVSLGIVLLAWRLPSKNVAATKEDKGYERIKESFIECDILSEEE